MSHWIVGELEAWQTVAQVPAVEGRILVCEPTLLNIIPHQAGQEDLDVSQEGGHLSQGQGESLMCWTSFG